MRETYSSALELNGLRAAQKHVSVFSGWLIVPLSKVVAGHKREGYRLKRTLSKRLSDPEPDSPTNSSVLVPAPLFQHYTKRAKRLLSHRYTSHFFLKL